MKYIFIAYILFGGGWGGQWQALPPLVFDKMETCSRYMDEVGKDMRFYKDTNQSPYPKDWKMTCKHFWDTEESYQQFLKELNAE